ARPELQLKPCECTETGLTDGQRPVMSLARWRQAGRLAMSRGFSSTQWWNEELEKRSRAPKPAPEDRPPEKKAPPEREDIAGALDLQLFAYPESRAWPTATLALLAVSAAATCAISAAWRQVLGADSVEDLRERLQSFWALLEKSGVSWQQLQCGELHRLVLCSLVRAGEQPAKSLSDAVLLLLSGALVERLYGARFLLLLVGSSTVLSNALALVIHSQLTDSTAGLSSSSGGLVALGAFAALRHGRWAAAPGLPLPIAWLMAPIVVADLSLARAYARDLAEYRSRVLSDKFETPQDGESADTADGLTGFQRAVALAACLGLEDRARAACVAPLEDVVVWRMELEEVEDLPPPPEAAIWADLLGGLFGASLALLRR
ncbi:unnamed protein product, partial [Effrenium voratum]